MLFSQLLSPLIVLLALTGSGLCAWPNGPFSTSGRWILDGSGANITYAGANWPGAADTMIPEGLQYSSIESIVTKIKSLGMNVIRLTYAIEMIDDIYESGSDTLLETSLINALGESNGTAVYNTVLRQNPQFNNGTTRLEVGQVSVSADLQDADWMIYRYSMPLPQSAINSRSGFILITMFRRHSGVVLRGMEILGLEILISIFPIGKEVYNIWRPM